MWSWHRNEYLFPLIERWEGYNGNGVLPIQAHKHIYSTKMFQLQGSQCRNIRAIHKGGSIEDLCLFCSKNFERFVNPNAICTFAYDKNKDSYYGWSTEDISLLTSGIEIPFVALLGDVEILNIHIGAPYTELEDMSFNIQRIINNLKKINNNLKIYTYIRTHPSTNFYTTRTLSQKSDSYEIWKDKTRSLLKKLEKLDSVKFRKKVKKLMV